MTLAADATPSAPRLTLSAVLAVARAEPWVVGPGVAMVVGFLALAVQGGGYAPAVWYPWSLTALALVVVVVLAGRACLPGRAATAALAAFGGYVGWSYLSITWARAPADALDGSNRALAYLAVFAVFAVLPWRPATAIVVLGALVGGIGLLAIGTVGRLALGGDPFAFLSDARLAAPTGYQNANAALWTMAALPALVGASRAEVPPVVRGVLLGAAGLFVQLAVLGQSRGWLVSFPIVVVLVALWSPRRWPVLLAAAGVATAALLVLPVLLEVYRLGGVGKAVAAPGYVGAVHRAAWASILSCAGLALVGTRYATWQPSPDHLRPLRRLAPFGLAAGLLLAGVAVPLVLRGHTVTASTGHFSGDESARYDYWRVAVDEFQLHPLGGLGQDNFGVQYLLRRQSVEEPRWTHSLELRLLAHTGAVGFALFAVFLVSVLAGGLRRLRGETAGSAALGVAAAAPLLLWLVHGSLDWLWEFPALTAPSLGFAAVALSLRAAPRRVGAPVPVGARARLRVMGVVAAVVAVVAVVAVAATAVWPAARAARDVDRATRIWRTSPVAATRLLAAARSLQPSSPRADVVAGLVAVDRGQHAEALARFEAAARTDPSDWFCQFAIGLLGASTGDTDLARTALLRAAQENPREPLVSEALGRLGSATPLTFEGSRSELQALLLRTTRMGAPHDYAMRVVDAGPLP